MPRIPEYQSDVSPFTNLPTPQASPRSFGGGSGLADLGAGLNDVSNALYDVQQRQEVSDVTTGLAKLRGQATADLDTRASQMQPGDPDFTSKFMQDFGNELSTMGGNIKTRAGRDAFARGSAELTAGFLDSATKYQIHSAGIKAVTDFKTTENANIGTLLRDPSQFDSILKDTDAALADPNGPFAKMPADKREELSLSSKEQYALGAARGIIRLNPQTALDLYQAGKLPGQEFLKDQSGWIVEQEAQAGITSQEVKARQLAAADAKAKHDAFEKTGADIFSAAVKNPFDPKITDMINQSGGTLAEKMSAFNFVSNLADKETREGGAAHDVKTYGTGFLKAFQAVHDGSLNTVAQIYPLVGKTLTVAGADKLVAEMSTKKTPEGQIEAELKNNFVKSALRSISGANELTGFRDPKGEELGQKALSWMLNEYERQKTEGKINATDLLDPNNPKSLWGGMMKYKRPMAQFMRDMMEANPGNPDVAMGAAAASGATTYKSAGDVSAAYKAGKLTREQAAAELKKNGWAQ